MESLAVAAWTLITVGLGYWVGRKSRDQPPVELSIGSVPTAGGDPTPALIPGLDIPPTYADHEVAGVEIPLTEAEQAALAREAGDHDQEGNQFERPYEGGGFGSDPGWSG